MITEAKDMAMMALGVVYQNGAVEVHAAGNLPGVTAEAVAMPLEAT